MGTLVAMADGGDAAPSRGQMKRDAKRSMYAYSTEKAVKMGVKSQVGKSREAAKYNAADKVCQTCGFAGLWTWECKEKRGAKCKPKYNSRPTRTQQLLNPKCRPRLMRQDETLPELKKEKKEDKKKRKRKVSSSSSSSSSSSRSSGSSDSSGSSGSDSSSDSSGSSSEEEKKKKKKKKED